MHTYFGGFGQTVISSLAKQLLSIVTISLLYAFLSLKKKDFPVFILVVKKGYSL